MRSASSTPPNGLGLIRRNGDKLVDRPWKKQACFAEAQSHRPILDEQRRLDSTGYPKYAPAGFHSPSAERKLL